MTLTLTLEPEEILILMSGARKITELADRSPTIAAALGLDTRTRKILRTTTQKIHNQATAQTRHNRIHET